MKITKFIVIISVLCISLYSKSVLSQNNTTYDFLKLDAGARSSSLAGSFSTTLNDVNTIFYNPAGLSTLNQAQASAGFFKYLLDINSGNIAYSSKLKNAGYIGGAIRYINYGSFEKFDEESNSLGTFSANELALSLGYSNKTRDHFHYGANLKFIYSGIDEYSSTGIAVDLGMLYLIPATQWNFGLSLLNAGFQLSKYNSTAEDLPLDLRIGVSKKLEHLPLNVHFELENLTATADSFFDRFKNFSLGGEFDISDYVKFRVGYNNSLRQDLKTGSSVGVAGFSTGIGFKFLDNYSFDYAVNSLGQIGATHRIDLGFNWKD